jgi:hypothetical protein
MILWLPILCNWPSVKFYFKKIKKKKKYIFNRFILI